MTTVNPIKEDVVFDESIAASIEDFDESMRKKFPPDIYEKIKILGAFLAQGLDEQECAILARISPERFSEIVENNADVRAFVAFKKTVLKAKLLKIVTGAAIGGKQEKTAGWILSRKYPAEFNEKIAGEDEKREPHLLEEGLRFVRENGDSIPLIAERKI